MQIMEYDRVILIGSGKIAVDCLHILLEHTTRVLCVEYARNPLSILETVCSVRARVSYINILHLGRT